MLGAANEIFGQACKEIRGLIRLINDSIIELYY